MSNDPIPAWQRDRLALLLYTQCWGLLVMKSLVEHQAEQFTVVKLRGAQTSWLHQQGLVISRDTNRLCIRFDGDNTVTSVLPHLVRVVEAPDGCSGPAD